MSNDTFTAYMLAGAIILSIWYVAPIFGGDVLKLMHWRSRRIQKQLDAWLDEMTKYKLEDHALVALQIYDDITREVILARGREDSVRDAVERVLARKKTGIYQWQFLKEIARINRDLEVKSAIIDCERRATKALSHAHAA